MSNEGARLLNADQIDQLGLALITLAKEVWVMKDRQMLVEALLQEQNMLAKLDSHQPTPELARRIALERERFLGSLTAVLFDDRNPTP